MDFSTSPVPKQNNKDQYLKIDKMSDKIKNTATKSPQSVYYKGKSFRKTKPFFDVVYL